MKILQEMMEYSKGFPSRKKQYRSPNTKVVLVRMQGILCQSEPKETLVTEMEEGDGNW